MFVEPVYTKWKSRPVAYPVAHVGSEFGFSERTTPGTALLGKKDGWSS